MKGIKERCIKDFRQVFKVFLVTHYCNTHPGTSWFQNAISIHFYFQDPFVLNNDLIIILQNKVSVVLLKPFGIHGKRYGQKCFRSSFETCQCNVLFPILRLNFLSCSYCSYFETNPLPNSDNCHLSLLTGDIACISNERAA